MGLGFGELIILLIIVLLVFGAGKLPQIGDALGKSIKNFKRAASSKDEIDVTPAKKELGDKTPDAPKNS
jgi:sec-independent protein translocase protein TatA